MDGDLVAIFLLRLASLATFRLITATDMPFLEGELGSRLVEVALTAGSPAAYLVDYAHEISDEWLAGATTVGLTSGASVPDELVLQVLDHLAERGFDQVAEFTTTQETLTFSLPQALKRDMRAAEAKRSAAVAASLADPA